MNVLLITMMSLIEHNYKCFYQSCVFGEFLSWVHSAKQPFPWPTFPALCSTWKDQWTISHTVLESLLQWEENTTTDWLGCQWKRITEWKSPVAAMQPSFLLLSLVATKTFVKWGSKQLVDRLSQSNTKSACLPFLEMHFNTEHSLLLNKKKKSMPLHYNKNIWT